MTSIEDFMAWRESLWIPPHRVYRVRRLLWTWLRRQPRDWIPL